MIDASKLDKPEFVRVILDRDLRNIFKAQLLAVKSKTYLKGKELRVTKRRQEGIQRRTGNLEDSLENPNYFIKSQGENFLAESNIPIYMRFLDMRDKGNHQIYNRILWGILYNNAYPDIRYGYGREIKDVVGDALRVVFGDKKINMRYGK